MNNNNAVIYWKKDLEDGWIMGGMVFKAENTENFESAYLELKPKLESPEIIGFVIEEHCCLDDVFEGDETYQFYETFRKYGLVYVFRNSEGELAKLTLAEEFVNLF